MVAVLLALQFVAQISPPLTTDGLTQLIPLGAALSSISSSNPGAAATKCIDQVLLGSSKTLICETAQEASPWLELDLGANHSLALVRIVSSVDQTRDSNLYVTS